MDPDDPSIFAADEQRDVAVDLHHYVRLARHVLTEERVAPDVELSLIFVDEATIAEYNERFLDNVGPTDVLAFPMDDAVVPGGRQPDTGGRGPGAPSEEFEAPTILGDVMVCPLYAQREASTRSVALEDELALLVVHGVLHLLDYDHAEAGDAEKMQGRERELLGSFAELHGRDAR